MSRNEEPIGIFDSGIGGLTVLKEMIDKLPSESTVYLGDTARVPYGIRSPETVKRYSFENTRFLSSKGIKMLVVACNTVSAISLDAIRNSLDVPVLGVIEPGARGAVAATRSKRVGVIGTSATISSSSYSKAITAVDPSVEVFALPCPLFVPLVEEGWTEGPIVEMVAERYLGEIKEKGIDTLVLGCTHYPLLKTVLAKVMGERVALIDSAIETAKEVEKTFQSASLFRQTSRAATREFYVTDSPQKFTEVGERFLGRKIEFIRKIELGAEV